MAYWLVDSPGSGDGCRDADFWLPHLREQGIENVTECRLDEAEQWLRLVTGNDVLLAAGGDGTVNGVAGLCLRTGATLAVLPSGTANDFARNLGIPSEPAEVARLVADGSTEMIDVAEFDDRIYLNVAHIGLGTLPSRQASSPTKKLLENSVTLPHCSDNWAPSGGSTPIFVLIVLIWVVAGYRLRLPRGPISVGAMKYRRPLRTMACWMS